jgi:hypothetical protein
MWVDRESGESQHKLRQSRSEQRPFGARVEQLVPTVHLRVLRIFDLQPRRAARIGLIRAVRPLRHDPLEVVFTRRLIEIASALRDVIEIQQPAFDTRHDPQQPALALEQRQRAQILAIDHQHVEHIEVRRVSAKQQPIEIAAPVGSQAADFPSRIAERQRTACATAAASVGQPVKMCPLRDTSWQ